ncbi:MAG: hypothetical protein ACI35S_03610 [Anaeroplasma sp.]
MKRRLSSFAILFVLIISLSACSQREILLFLNWGEYIDETLITAFEEKYHCTVLMDLADSNEIFYSKARAGTTVYDVICPSDYMVEKMYNNDMLERIDFSKLANFDPDSENIRYGVKSITSIMQKNCDSEIKNYFVPYLWGTWGIMYNTELEGLEDAVTKSRNDWACLFDRSVLPAGTKVAMYDSHLHAYYAACRYLGFNNVYDERPNSDLDKIESIIKKMKYNAWGTDNIKKDIVAGNIDLGFMWTGDFLYYYCENVANTVMDAYLAKDIDYVDFEDMIRTLTSNERIYRTKNGKEYTVGFDFYIPSDTVAFCDNLIITKDAANKDLAYKFIDFLCSNTVRINEEDEVYPAFSNTYYVCYDTPFVDIFDEIIDLRYPSEGEEKFTQADIELFNSEGGDSYDSTLYWTFYDYANSIGFEKYYPKDGANGSILPNFDRSYIDRINTTFNNARI